MADRVCRAVGLDVHGLMAERRVPDIVKHPEEVVFIAQRRAAESYATAMERVLRIQKPTIDPQALWEAEQTAFAQVHREPKEQRRPISHADFLIAVNVMALRILFPRLGDIRDKDATLLRIARQVRKLRRRYHNDATEYTTYPDVRKLIRWIHAKMRVPMYIVTGVERKKLRKLIAICKLEKEVEYTAGAYCSNELGYNKLSPRYWNEIVRRIGHPAHEIMMIGNEVSIDASCTDVGMPVAILDRGGIRRKFYVERGGDNEEANRKTLNGVPYLDLSKSDPDPLPPRRPFIGIALDPIGIQQALSRTIPMRAGEVVNGDVSLSSPDTSASTD